MVYDIELWPIEELWPSGKEHPTWRVFPTWVLVPKCLFFSLIVVLSSYIFQAVVHLFKVAKSSAIFFKIQMSFDWRNGGGFRGCVLDFVTIVINDGNCILQEQLWKYVRCGWHPLGLWPNACNSKTFIIIPGDHIICHNSIITMG